MFWVPIPPDRHGPTLIVLRHGYLPCDSPSGTPGLTKWNPHSTEESPTPNLVTRGPGVYPVPVPTGRDGREVERWVKTGRDVEGVG